MALGVRAGELRKIGPRYRPAVGDGLEFKEWLSAVWADVVDAPDPEERRKNEASDTNWKVDFDATDPKRAAIYFSKYSVVDDKEYQNIPPVEWRESGKGPADLGCLGPGESHRYGTGHPRGADHHGPGAAWVRPAPHHH